MNVSEKSQEPVIAAQECPQIETSLAWTPELETKGNVLQRDLSGSRWLCVELPAIEYREAWDLQGKLVAARKQRILDRDTVLLLEHPPVFTLGRRGGLNNLKVSGDFLEKTGIPAIRVERGGDITYHGPGQLVVYPIVDLHAARLNVVDYVGKLEEVMLRTAADWGIKAERKPVNRGVWVGSSKLGSIGIAVRRGISFHGLAFNVNTSLEPFCWIHPCGLRDVSMTSMERELARRIPMNEVREGMKRHIEAVFQVELEVTGLLELRGLLERR